jgi:hypothetical protein
LLTTLAEMNCLYGAYAAAIERNDKPAAHLAWQTYVAYVRRYNSERGIEVVLNLPE